MNDATYNNQKVYLPQGADRIVGTSGGFFDMETGFELNLTTTSNPVSAAQMRAQLWNPAQFSIIANSAGALSVINLPSAGYIIFSIAQAASNASAWLTSMAGIPGQVMHLMMRGAGVVGSVYISMSGVSVVGTHSGDISSISLLNSVATESMGYIKLLCTDTDEWSIVERRGQVVERGSA
jgi:hypothetical protein